MNALDIEQAAADWLVKRTSGTWTDEQQAELDAWIDANLAHRIAYVRLETVWNETGRLQALAPAAAPGAAPPRGALLATASLPLEPAPGPRDEEQSAVRASSWPRRHVMALAASLTLLVAAGLMSYAFWSSGDRYVTPIGAIDTVALADGSQITLNTDTRLRVALTATERFIELEQGEAYFEVARDRDRPFIVDAGEKRIIAVGTRFSVRREASEIRVIVTEGAVRFEAAGAQPPASGEARLLSAGAVAQIGAAGITLREESPGDIHDHLSWRGGYLVFRDTPLAEAVAEFNRYTPRKIVIEDPEIAAIRVGGQFRFNSVDVFLWMLQNGFPIRVDQEGDTVVLASQ